MNQFLIFLIAFSFNTTSKEQWTEVNTLDETIVLDLKYATKDNFVKEKLYDCPRCFLRPDVAKAVIAAHKELKKKGYGGLKLFDCYRPRPIQRKLWKILPDDRYVANPDKGSMHNRGSAVDLTIVDKKGKELDMGTEFDYFGPEGYHSYTKLSKQVLTNRKLLRETLAKHGLHHIKTEWWHYSYRAKQYELSDWVWGCNKK
ncbi:MAG: M15 family metallopeptidase [Saprospiraceae bacterium]|nr:M15 family metallopeptidase [Saprospiraceae bacterium]